MTRQKIKNSLISHGSQLTFLMARERRSPSMDNVFLVATFTLSIVSLQEVETHLKAKSFLGDLPIVVLNGKNPLY